ncbi:MAG: WG repeat-containing protein, partial [Clostridia bacterium]
MENEHGMQTEQLDPLTLYRLADEQIKAGNAVAAITSIEAAMRQRAAYPSQAAWRALIQQIRFQLLQRSVGPFRASLKTTEGTKWGYINDKGQFIISPRYDYADDFQENGLAMVIQRERSGLINRQGQYVVAPKYDSISRFSEGRASVTDDKGTWVMDEQGKILTAEPYDFIAMYQNGRATFSVTKEGMGRYGYLDRDGKVVIPARYENGTDFHNDKAVVKVKEGEYALIGKNGERLQTYRYPFVGPLGDGLLAFQQQENGPYGYIDEKGSVVIKPTFSEAQPFQAGRAVVNAAKEITDPNQYGLIDKQGAYRIRPEYNLILMLGEGRVSVGKAKDAQKPYMGSLFAIADTDGRFLTDFRYNDVQDYHDGLASANDDQQTFFIDRQGQIVRNLPVLPGIGSVSLEGNVVRADIELRTAYYDRNGKLIWQQNTVIPLTNQYRVREEKYRPNKDYIVYYPQVEGMVDQEAQNRINQRLKSMSQVKPVPGNVQLDYSYTGDFSVEFFKKNLVVLQLLGYNFPAGAAHGMPSQVYAHVDLARGNMYELKDLFKPNSNYVNVLSEIVGTMIKTDPKYSYVFPGSYTGIKPNQPFYVNENALYLYFEPYEIGPYVAGF